MRDDPRYAPTSPYRDWQVEMEFQTRLQSFFPTTRTGSTPSTFFCSDNYLSFGSDEAAQNSGKMYQRLPEEMPVPRAAPHPPQAMEAERSEPEWPQ